MSQGISDGDLVRLARDGDAVAFRLLVERHLPMARARARRLCANPSDVDDIVQESFLQAFLALDRLRDPDRFPGWLAGIVLNACRALRRGPHVALLPDWPEPLHPAATDGQPSAENLDRADALRAAVASLPAGQRHAVALHYYADVPAGQAGGSPGAARVSLHKARLRLRDYLTEHRPDLVSGRRTPMTDVRVARVERRIPPGPVPDRYHTHVIVLADDAGHRELPIWLSGHDGMRISVMFERRNPEDENAGTIQGTWAKASTAEELTRRLLHAAGARMTSVDIDELGPEVPVARIGLTGPAGSGNVTARLPDGLAIAITAGTPIRVADAVLDRLAVPASPDSAPDSEPGTVPRPAAGAREQTASEQTASELSPRRPRYEPRNMAFAEGLSGWLLDGSFREHSEDHWRDYAAAADNGTAVLYAATPDPAGFAILAQLMWADDYRGSVVSCRGRLRRAGAAGLAGLFVRVETPGSGPGPGNPLNLDDVLADAGTTISTAAAIPDWAQHEVTARVPADCRIVMFGIFLAGSGRIELREPELVLPPLRDELRGHTSR